MLVKPLDKIDNGRKARRRIGGAAGKRSVAGYSVILHKIQKRKAVGKNYRFVARAFRRCHILFVKALQRGDILRGVRRVVFFVFGVKCDKLVTQRRNRFFCKPQRKPYMLVMFLFVGVTVMAVYIMRMVAVGVFVVAVFIMCMAVIMPVMTVNVISMFIMRVVVINMLVMRMVAVRLGGIGVYMACAAVRVADGGVIVVFLGKRIAEYVKEPQQSKLR